MAFNFRHIPDSVLLHIFNFLSYKELAKVSLVSKTWKRISIDASLWKSLRFDNDSESTMKQILSKRTFALLTQLNLNNCSLSPLFLVTLSRKCLHLKELTLQKCLFARAKRRYRLHVFRRLKILDARRLEGNTEFLTRFLRCTPDLETLAVDNSVGENWSVKPFKKLNKLRVLDLTRCIEVTEEDVSIVADSCRALESLLLRRCHKVNGRCLSFLLRNCKTLKTLSLASTNVTDEALCACDWNSDSLEEIDLSSCPEISPRGLSKALGKLTKLKYLNLRDCDYESGPATAPNILTFVIPLRSLEVLNLDSGDIPFEGKEDLVCKIAENCPKISCLVVGQTFKTALCLERCLRCLSQLTRFSICYQREVEDLILNPRQVDIPPNGFGLEILVNTLAKNCHKLEALELSGFLERECEIITNSFVQMMKDCRNLARISSFGGNADVLVMAADAIMRTRRHDVRLIKPTMLFPSPRGITPPPRLCFDRVVYNKEVSGMDDPWRGPFLYEIEPRNLDFL